MITSGDKRLTTRRSCGCSSETVRSPTPKKNSEAVPERLKLVIKRGSRQAWDRAKAAWQTNDLLFNMLWTYSTIESYLASINFLLVLLLSFFFLIQNFIQFRRLVHFFFIDFIVYNNLKKTRQAHWRSKYKYKTSDKKGDKIKLLGLTKTAAGQGKLS